MPEKTLTFEVIRRGGFILTLSLWAAMANLQSSHKIDLVISGAAILFIPVSLAGRKLIDANPVISHTVRVTTVIHYAGMILLGASLIKAIQVSNHWPLWVIPLPSAIGLLLMIISGIIVAMTVVELANESLGAPFAIALSERLAKRGIYTRTRNPMVLSLLIFLFSLGLALRTLFFIAWVLLLFTPALLIFVRVFEERELEIRFGQEYLDYKSRTSMLWPGKPKP